MQYLKYLWFLGILAGGWLIKTAWHDPVEGPYIRFFGFLIALVCLIRFLEAYRRSITADISKQPE